MFDGHCFKAMALHTLIFTCTHVFACFVSHDIWVLFTFDEQCLRAMLLLQDTTCLIRVLQTQCNKLKQAEHFECTHACTWARV